LNARSFSFFSVLFRSFRSLGRNGGTEERSSVPEVGTEERSSVPTSGTEERSTVYPERRNGAGWNGFNGGTELRSDLRNEETGTEQAWNGGTELRSDLRNGETGTEVAWNGGTEFRSDLRKGETDYRLSVPASGTDWNGTERILQKWY